jgi:purine-binding chemotaxis protein CheW
MDMSDLNASDRPSESADLESSELELLRQRAARYAQEERSVDRDSPDAVVFERGGSRYAVLVTDLREIRPLRRLCSIPGTSRVVPGVFYYRGEILAAHDLGCLLIERDLPAMAPWILVLEHQGNRIGLLADSIADIAAVATEKVRLPPVTLGEGTDVFHGVLDGGALLINPARLLTTPKFSSAL